MRLEFDDGSQKNIQLLRIARSDENNRCVQCADRPDTFEKAEMPKVRLSISEAYVLKARMIKKWNWQALRKDL